MTEPSKKEQLYQLIRANPFISQQDLAIELRLSRSAVAGHIAGLIRERRLLGRAYVLPDKRPIVCIGAANLDRKLRTLAPLRLGTSNPASAEEVFGGVARNIAENLIRLAIPSALLTALGTDAAGRALADHAEAAGIDLRGSLHVADCATGTYTAVLDADGEMTVALADMALYDRLTPAFLASRLPQRSAAAMTVADLNLPRDAVALLLADARHEAVPLVIVAVSQPKMARLPADLHGLRLLILNRGELETRVGRALPTEDDVAAACREVQAQGARDVIVTCGGQGVFHTSAGRLAWLPARQVEVVDVTGAGDAFAAAVCWSLYQGSDDLGLACRRGLKVAAMTLESQDTVSPVLAADVLDEINDFDLNAPLFPAPGAPLIG
ncbi:carbohydrate kinase [Rugamonas apoptosis]|uniref:Bifunctional hydroxymethylpyrimidine kinase/phosphomethylpyrimidine kinase n=1 Tax=Rugamonas apoptosis TaxID=2758570 RepID=A0A7W2ILD1_9BURK|nr:carbohydrate kinase [Rugamonas apoptosis]MBA5688352.1 bifunctional hydroxymethylpyrimidine kinase/phosphomethylpyrimidine kinase [Rugamonas apoptosis]